MKVKRIFCLLFAVFSYMALLGVRFLRPVVREIVFGIARKKLVSRSDVSRVLVYGSGLRYRAFRRELVRSLTVNNRVVVGLLDDNLLLHGKYVGGVKVLGGIRQAPKLIAEHRIDAVVIACEISEEKEKIVLDLLAPTGAKIFRFGFYEKQLMV